MFASEQIQQVSEALMGASKDLVEAVTAEEWANPYWADRYGERGLRFIRQDCQYHLDTLITSIQVDQAVFMTNHYKWLQGVLLHRGLCSRHLHESIASFDRQIAERLPQFWPFVHPFHAAAYRGLEYAAPVCQALSEHEEKLAELVIQRIWAENPDWKIRLGSQGEAVILRENRYQLSYLQDALGCQEPELFSGYLAWFSSYKEARRIIPQMLHLELTYLAEEITNLLPKGEIRQAVELINQTLAAM